MPPRPKKPSSSSPQKSPNPTSTSSASQEPPNPSLESKDLRMSYRIGRGEQGVLTFEPYKSTLLPHWRFRTSAIARTSSTTLKSEFFDRYVRAGDFVGADMSRKFIQMGMTRARRYANYKGGRKYVQVKSEGNGEQDDGEGEAEGKGKLGGKDGGKGKVLKEKSLGHEGQEEKARASEVFKEVWRRCLADEGYLALKKEFVEEQKRWDREQKKQKGDHVKMEKGRGVKAENEMETDEMED